MQNNEWLHGKYTSHIALCSVNLWVPYGVPGYSTKFNYFHLSIFQGESSDNFNWGVRRRLLSEERDEWRGVRGLERSPPPPPHTRPAPPSKPVSTLVLILYSVGIWGRLYSREVTLCTSKDYAAYCTPSFGYKYARDKTEANFNIIKFQVMINFDNYLPQHLLNCRYL